METTANYNPPIYLKDNEQRAKNVIITFWVLIVISVFAVVSGYFELELLQIIEKGGNYTDAQIESNDARQGVIGIVQTITTIILAVLFIMWFRRAYVNAGAVADRRLEREDWWAVWGFFIPIIYLWYPYSIASEINDKMDRFLKQNSSGVLTNSIGWIIGLWWAFYLAQGVIGQILFKLVFKDETIEDFITASQITIFSDLFDIIAALVTIFMIMKISDKEKVVKKVVQQVNKKNALNALNTTSTLALEEE